MVEGGVPESVIIQKIRTSRKKFDTGADALIKLKGDGVPDKVIEAMMAGHGDCRGSTTTARRAATAAEPVIVHVVGRDQKKLKAIVGNMEFEVAPFVGSRQEVVLQENRAHLANIWTSIGDQAVPACRSSPKIVS